MNDATITPEQIAKNYAAAMNSVDLINGPIPELSRFDPPWTETIKRNQDQLKIMLAKPYWTTEDLTPLQLASVLIVE